MDAKAKAEARRAKILARNTDRLSLAKGVQPQPSAESAVKELTEEAPLSEVKAARPLAARRSLIESISVASSENESFKNIDNSPEKESFSKTLSEDPEVESVSEFEEIKKQRAVESSIAAIQNEETKSDIKYPNKPNVSVPPNEPLSKRIPAKSTKEVEREIAERTAKFDKNLLSESKEPKKVVKSVKSTLGTANSIKPSQVMKIIRLIGVLLMGILMGFRSSRYHSPQISSTIALFPKSFSYQYYRYSYDFGLNDSVSCIPRLSTTVDLPLSTKVDDFSAKIYEAGKSVGGTQQSCATESPSAFDPNSLLFLNATAARDNQKFSTSRPDGTWIGWLGNYLIKQSESSLSAIGLVWWIAGLFERPVSRIFVENRFKGDGESDKGNILTKLLNLYASGIQGLVEMSLGSVGEILLHCFVVILACSFTTHVCLLGSLSGDCTFNLVAVGAALQTMDVAINEAFRSGVVFLKQIAGAKNEL